VNTDGQASADQFPRVDFKCIQMAPIVQTATVRPRKTSEMVLAERTACVPAASGDLDAERNHAYGYAALTSRAFGKTDWSAVVTSSSSELR